MRVALEVWSNDFARVESTCRTAEDLGFDAFYYGESPNDLNLECWTTLAALARATSRIRLGPVIANALPTYRSTALLVRQVEAVASVSGDRLDFRTGVGAAARFGRAWWEPCGVEYPDYPTRLSYTIAAIEAVAQWRAGSGRSVPITVAARGDRAMGLAASHADVWETSFATPPEFAERNERMTGLAAGRPLLRSLEIDGFLSSSPDGLQRLLDRVRAERGVAEDTDAVLARALVGLPDQAADHLARLAEAGVDQVLVALHDPHDPDALDALAEAVATHHA